MAVLLYYAECGSDLPDVGTIKQYQIKVIEKCLEIGRSMEVIEVEPAIIFTPIFCLIMYLAAKSRGACRVLLLVLAALSYGIYLHMLK